MTTLDYENPEHHETIARYARLDVETFRSYLEFADNPHLIAWATGRAQAAALSAEVEETFAAAIRAHQSQPVA